MGVCNVIFKKWKTQLTSNSYTEYIGPYIGNGGSCAGNVLCISFTKSDLHVHKKKEDPDHNNNKSDDVSRKLLEEHKYLEPVFNKKGSKVSD